jgi:Flp pilus assembly pilin Flp
MIRRLVHDSRGQDLVEYALLALLVGLVSVAALGLLEVSLQTAYSTWGTRTEALSCMPSPGGGGCP